MAQGETKQVCPAPCSRVATAAEASVTRVDCSACRASHESYRKARRRDGGAHANTMALDCELLTSRILRGVLQRYRMFRLVSASLLTNPACASTAHANEQLVERGSRCRYRLGRNPAQRRMGGGSRTQPARGRAEPDRSTHVMARRRSYRSRGRPNAGARPKPRPPPCSGCRCGRAWPNRHTRAR